MPEERSMPASPEAERALLGSILVGTPIPPDLDPEDFSLDAHRQIFTTMRDLDAIDELLVIDKLRAQGDLESIGGVSAVVSLTEGIPRRLNIESYIRIIREKAQLRELINACDAAISRAMEQVSISDCMTSVENALLAIESRREGSETYHISEFLPQSIMYLREEAESGGLVGFTTGVDGLDDRTTGIRKGELWLIGGLSNSGKTPLGVQIAMTNARNRVPTMIFSIEMSRYQMASRILAESGVISSHKLRRPKMLTTVEWANLMSEEMVISKLPVWLNDASQIKLSELLMRAKLAIRMRQVQLIVIDYLMLIDAPGKELRHQADAITKSLKALAKSQQVAVVLLAQFRRPQNVNDRPNLTWFKESGGIEATANTALAVYRPVEDDEVTPTGEDEIVILKQREGERGAIPVYFNEKQLRFYDREVRA